MRDDLWSGGEGVHYEQPPLKGRPPGGSFIVPRDVTKALGGGDEELGNLVLLDTFGVHPMSAPLGAIHPDAVRDVGHGCMTAGRKVLTRFVAKVRRRHTTENKSTKAAAHYRNGTENRHCAICAMFRPPDACTAVEGKIKLQDTCDLFEKVHADTA